MIDYKGQLNLGNEALGAERSISANEVVRTAEIKDLAREIHHQNTLIPEQVAEAVLENFGNACVELLSMGFAVQFKKGDDVLMRIFPDVHVKGGNINLTRAKQLDPEVTDLTLENAGDLIDRAGGVQVRVRAVCQQKFTEMLDKQGAKVQRTDIVEVPYVAKKNEAEPGDDGDDGGKPNQGGNEEP